MMQVSKRGRLLSEPTGSGPRGGGGGDSILYQDDEPVGVEAAEEAGGTVPAEEKCDRPRVAKKISPALGLSTTTEDVGRRLRGGRVGTSAEARERCHLWVRAW
jgi:hypothetical protein